MKSTVWRQKRGGGRRYLHDRDYDFNPVFWELKDFTSGQLWATNADYQKWLKEQEAPKKVAPKKKAAPKKTTE